MNKWRVVGSPMMKQGSWEMRDKDGLGALTGRIEMSNNNNYRAFINRWERVRVFGSFDKARAHIEEHYA
jgi:hypothetical protein